MKFIFISRCCQVASIIVFYTTPMFAQSYDIHTYNIIKSIQNIEKPFTPKLSEVADQEYGRLPALQPSVISIACGTDGLPDMPQPQASSATQDPGATSGDFRYRANFTNSPPANAGVYNGSNLAYWSITSAVFASNIAAIELMERCLAAHSCYAIPIGMRSRPAMYGIGLDGAIGTSIVGYYLRKKDKRWWSVPGLMATSFDLVFVAGAARRPH